MNTAELRKLPKWKSLDEARKERMAALHVRIAELHEKLLTLQAEAPDNTNCGWFSFGNNESFELDRQFTMTKDALARAERELNQLTSASLKQPWSNQARHGDVIVVVDRQDNYSCYRLVLTPEPDKDDARIMHVELASPLGSQLLGVEENAEIVLGFGPNRKQVEIVEIIRA